MRRRKLKNVAASMTVSQYRAILSNGSKKDRRRWKALRRHCPGIGRDVRKVQRDTARRRTAIREALEAIEGWASDWSEPGRMTQALEVIQETLAEIEVPK